MIRRPAFLVAILVHWMLLVYLLAATVATHGAGAWWQLWQTMTRLCLLATAYELSLLLFWLLIRCGGLKAPDVAPPIFGEAEADELAIATAQVAILIPLHMEARTHADARELARRVFETLLASPRNAIVFLMFDSPVDQGANELAVVAGIRARLVAAGSAADIERLQYMEYRDKPETHRNKPGSIVIWLKEHHTRFKYVLVLDGDSSFISTGRYAEQGKFPVERMLLAMERSERAGNTISMLQAAPLIPDPSSGECRSPWARYQAACAQIGMHYYGEVVLKGVLAGQVPSYGHNVIFRTWDLKTYCVNSLRFLSHDHVDAADLIAAGCRCEFTNNVVMGEEPEPTVFHYEVREQRWSQGNAGWIEYVIENGIHLPLGPWLFLTTGILAYLLPLAATIALQSAVVLAAQGVVLFAAWDIHAALLTILVFISLLWGKLAGSRSLSGALLAISLPLLLAPAMCAMAGTLFLVGVFSKEWRIRGSRAASLDLDLVHRTSLIFAPLSFLGGLLVVGLSPLQGQMGILLLKLAAWLLYASPLTAACLSIPFRWAPKRVLPALFTGTLGEVP